VHKIDDPPVGRRTRDSQVSSKLFLWTKAQGAEESYFTVLLPKFIAQIDLFESKQ